MGEVKASMWAGVGRVDITPPLPIDLFGYARRWKPAKECRSPLQANALALRQGSTTVVILTVDLVAIQDPWAADIRRRVAEVAETDPSHVLLNASHTHAGPPASRPVKVGGNQRVFSKVEDLYLEYLPYQIEATARLALQRMEPVRVAYGRGSVELAVNRRERTPEGKTILGWNRDGPCDRDVCVLRFDALWGRPRAFLVNYACHPVVVGPEDPAISSDFVGPLRDFIERITGAPCLFLQGAAGNVLPLEAFFDHPGPEASFGERVALEALHAVADARGVATEIVRQDYASATPIHLYRRQPAAGQPDQPLAARAETVTFPLLPLPSMKEARRTVEHFAREYQRARDSAAPPEVLNPIEYHLLGAERTLKEMESGNPRTEVPATIQALRIGDCAIAAVPGEVFSEIALAVKARSPAALTMFAGYSNGCISYLPTAAEYPFGGYECTYANRSYGLPTQVAPETSEIIVSSCRRLIEELFSGAR